jgi:hypothetical protein
MREQLLKLPASVILNEVKDLAPRVEILRFAQDDNLCIQGDKR